MTGFLLPVLGILLCGAVLAVMLRTQRPEMALLLGVAVGVVVLFRCAEQIVPLLSTLHRMAQTGGMTGAYLTVIVKAAGVCLLTQMTADTCRDAGENALATKAELAGQTVLLLLSVPLFEDILQLAQALIIGQGAGG